jgi:predicted DNA binding protein
VNEGDSGALRRIRVDAAPAACPVCEYTREEGQRAVMRPADPRGTDDGLPFTVNLLGDREATRAALELVQETPQTEAREVVNLSPYAMVLKGIEQASAEHSPLVLSAIEDLFGEDLVVDPFLVDDGVARIRALVTEPSTTREVLQKLQGMQEAGDWDEFQVRGVNAFDPREHVGLFRRVLPPDQETLLRLAVDMGYYETPKKCTLVGIGEQVGLSASPVHKRLKESEERLVEAFLEPENVTRPETVGETPDWVQDVARGSGPMVEILARYRWEDSPLHRYMEAYPDARILFHPFYDDPQIQGSAFLALAVGGDPTDFLEGTHQARGLGGAEILREADGFAVARVEGQETDKPGEVTPMLEVTRRFGREAYLNPVYAEGGDVWLSLVTARSLTYEDVERTLHDIGEDVGLDDWDVVSLDPLEERSMGGRGPDEDLTDRQREVLDIARALGYYETPRESTLEDIAGTLGVSENAIHKNLSAAERKIVRGYLRSSR